MRCGIRGRSPRRDLRPTSRGCLIGLQHRQIPTILRHQHASRPTPVLQIPLLVSSLTSASGGCQRLVTAKSYELNRLASLTSSNSELLSPVPFADLHNNANQRVSNPH